MGKDKSTQRKEISRPFMRSKEYTPKSMHDLHQGKEKTKTVKKVATGLAIVSAVGALGVGALKILQRKKQDK